MTNKELFTALISGLALIISTIITGFFMTAPVQVTIQATQTAEARMTSSAASNVSTPTNLPNQQATPTALTVVLSPTPNKSQSPTPIITTQLPSTSRIAGLPFQPTRLFFVIAGLGIFFLFIWTLINNKLEKPIWAKTIYSIGSVSPFVVIWSRFFFDVPSDISTSNVLLTTTVYLSTILWFETRVYAWVYPNLKRLIIFGLIVLFPTFIVSFGFTDWNELQAFLTAIGLSIIVDVYLFFAIFQRD